MTCKPEGTHHNACDCREDQFKAILQRNLELLNALYAIKRHIEIAVPKGHEFSSVWKIVDRVLAKK